MRYLVFAILTITIGLSACNTESTTLPPNVILIYADDLGRGLLGTYGQKIIQTPNIDMLAEEGMRFENAYGCMYCAPARASLLTGMHDCHENEWNIVNAGIYKELDNGLTLEQIKERIHAVAKPAREGGIFLGQVAKQAGYTTAEFGKLEWGFATSAERIERHGWDYHFGYYDHLRCHGFYPPFLFENGEVFEIPGNTHVDCGRSRESDAPEEFRNRWNMEGKEVYSENIIMEKLLSFIDNHHPGKTNKPFFIYFPTQLPHGPIMVPEVHPDFVNNDSLSELEKEYASMVKMLDTDVGRIYSKVKELDILDNTIIIFTSDNGHEIYYASEGKCVKGNFNLSGDQYDNITSRYTSRQNGDVFDGNDGMSGLKRSNWEGGTRVPLFWYWKDHIEPGTVSEQMVSNYDFLNTLAEIVGGEQIKGKDGISYAQTLWGAKSELRDYTIFSSVMGPALVTQDGWKLRYFLQKDVFQLYYLPDDYREEVDLASQHTEKVEKLKSILYEECDRNWHNGLGPKRINP